MTRTKIRSVFAGPSNSDKMLDMWRHVVRGRRRRRVVMVVQILHGVDVHGDAEHSLNSLRTDGKMKKKKRTFPPLLMSFHRNSLRCSFLRHSVKTL